MAYRLIGWAAVLTVIAVPAFAPSGWAQGRPTCGDRSDLLAQLKEKFDEKPTGVGLTGNGTVVELTKSSSGSWTLLLSFADGRSCLMAAGENWEQAPEQTADRRL
jgi:hypothetical protein